jgi:hypothetical protein
LTGHLTFLAFKNFDKFDVYKYTKIYTMAFILFLSYMVFEVFGPHWVSTFYTKSNVFDKRLFVNATVILLLLFWPFFLFCQKKWGEKAFYIFVFLGVPFAVFLFLFTQPHAVLFGIVLSTIGLILSRKSYKWVKAFKYFIILFCMGFFCLLSQTHLLKTYSDEITYIPTSYQHRLYIWTGMTEKNHDLNKKLFGNEFGFTSTVKGGAMMCFRQKKIHVSFNPISITSKLDPDCPTKNSVFTSHPHNGFVQIFVELGIVGLLIFLTFLWKFCSYIENQKDKVLRSIYFATFLSYFTIFFISFNLWQTSMAGLMILTVNSLFVISRYLPQKQKS